MGFSGILTQTASFVGLILVVVTREEHDLRVSFEGQNVCGDTVEEPPVVTANHRDTGKLQKRFFKSSERFDI